MPVEGPLRGPGHTVVAAAVPGALRGHEVLEDGLMLLCWYRGKLLEWQLLGLLPGEVHIMQCGGKGFGHELIPERWHHLAH